MTLIELVVVLGLLAALATLALTTLDSMSDRTRMDTTRNRLDKIEQAIVGDGLTAGRFISDMGRLPVVQDTGSGAVLCELWATPPENDPNDSSDDILYDFAKVIGLRNTGSAIYWPEAGNSSFNHLPDEVTLMCGWNGPYMIPNGDNLYDGFGNDFRIANTPVPDPETESDWYLPGAAPAGTSIYGVISLGRDDEFAEDGWAERNQVLVFDSLCPVATLTVTVKALRVVPGETPAVWKQVTSAPDSISADSFSDAGSSDQFTKNTSWVHYNSVLYCCVRSGNKGDHSGRPPSIDEAEDNEAVWEPYEQRPEMNHLCVALFMPEVSDVGKGVGWAFEQQPEDLPSGEVIDGIMLIDGNDLTPVEPLMPGVRRLYVYGYVKYSDENSNEFEVNRWSSGPEPQTIELKPGTNFITVYLTEELTEALP